ncbi:homeobox protein Wariai-like [Panonychus citri]|uniref:homeobox protein Wariai-like n=1 Tax=Panonychus citri TaxID=50023 RepID=UPI0023082E25|nr:homeobox protein Wariai-like [Panonychus citri]
MVSIADSLTSTGQWASLAYPTEYLTINSKATKSNHNYPYANGTINSNQRQKLTINNKINPVDSNSNIALFDSIRNQRYRQCLLLIQSGQDVNGRNESGETPLIFLVKTLNRKEQRKMRIKFAKLLIDFGANPNIQDSRGQTALIHATIKGQDDVVQLLLSHVNTDITIQDKEGNTALMHGAKSGQSNVVECFVGHFIKRELDPNLLRQRNNYGKNALEIAKEESKGEIVSQLTNYLTQFNSIYSKDLERWTSIRPTLSKAKSLDSISVDSDGTYVTSDYHNQLNHDQNHHTGSQYHLDGKDDDLIATKMKQCSLSRRHYNNNNNSTDKNEANCDDNLTNCNSFETALRKKIENLKSINRSTDYYEEIWEQETMSWFGNGEINENTNSTINKSQLKTSTKSSSSKSSSSKGGKSDVIKANPDSNHNQEIAQDCESLKLPPIGSNRLIDYKTWCDLATSSRNNNLKKL